MGNKVKGFQVESGISPGAIVVLDETGSLPAVDGSNLTGVGGGLFTEDSDNNILGGTGAGANLTATSALNNFIAGVNAGATFTVGDENVIIGNESFQYPQIGSTRNVILGYRANQGQSGDSTNMSQSVVIGDQAQRYYIGTGNNVAIGYQAAVGNGAARSTATLQVNIGYIAGQFNQSSQSVAIGFGALQSLSGTPVTGVGNVGIGSAALSGIQGTAAGNVGIGQSVGTGLDTGDNNVFIGADCGDSITTGDANVCIGYNAGPTTNQSNQLYIHNSETDTPLIHGNFAGGSEKVTINGDLEVTGDILTSAFGSPAGPGVPIGIDLGEYTVANLPAASTYPNSHALATDASGGRTIVRSDGTNWKVVAVEGATVTT